MKITQNEFNALTSAHGINPADKFGIAIAVRIPYGRTATRIIASAPTYENANEVAKHIRTELADKIDFASVMYMPEVAMAIQMSRETRIAKLV